MAQHNQLGRYGESVAAAYLQAHGYKILHRNWHFNHCEIDIVAQHDGVLVIVEVKTRRNTAFGLPQDAMTDAKIQHLADAAEAYVQQFELNLPVRIDLVSIVTFNGRKQPSVRLIQNAFDASSC